MTALPIEEQAQSPFIPETKVQYAWDSTSLDWFKRCPRLYQYQMIEGWVPNAESDNLRFGIEYHKALQDYDVAKAEGADHESNLRSCIRDILRRTADWDPDHKYKNKIFLLRSVIWYLDQFRDDPAQTYILEGGKPAVELSFRFELDFAPAVDWSQPYLLCGHLDRVVDYQGSLFPMDRKTTSKGFSDYYWVQFEPNNQMSLYTLAGQIVIGSPMRGIIIDGAAVQIEETKFARRIFYRTPDQISEWLKDLRIHLNRAEDCAVDEYWPMNDTACDKYGGCPFRSVCSSDPKVRDQILKSDFHKRDPWNPLTPR